MLYPLLEQYDIDCKRAITYGFSRTEAGFELKKELPDAGLYAVFAITGKRFPEAIPSRNSARSAID